MPQLPIHVVTHAFPFGDRESFVMDELRRLSRHGPTVVTPALRLAGPVRELPSGVELDMSLADRPMFGVPSIPILASLLRRLLREVRNKPSLLLRPKAMIQIGGYLIRGARSASWLVQRKRTGDPPDRILCYWANSEAFGTAVAKGFGVESSFNFRVHGFDVHEPSYPGGHLPFRGDIAEVADRIVPVSEFGRQLLLERHPDMNERIRLARLGVSPPASVQKAMSEACLESGADRRTVLTVSNDAAVKRLDFVADAIQAAARRSPEVEWRWVHVGSGVDRLARRFHGCSDLIFDSRGQLSQDQVFETYVDVVPDVFVNLSSREGVPVSIMESLAMGVPVVATDAGGTGELVDNTVGMLLPVNVELEEAARAIREISGVSNDFRSAARARWASSASDAFAEQMLVEALSLPVSSGQPEVVGAMEA